MQPNTLTHGDCLEILPTLPPGSANFILTDPPYLVNFTPRDGRIVPNDDNDSWLKPAFAEMYRVLTDGAFCVSFYAWKEAERFLQAYRAAGFHIAGHFVFPKRYTSKTRFVRYQHECAYLLVKGTPWLRDENTIGDVIDWTYSGNNLHPTQKPISVLMQLIEAFSSPGDLVLDPFAGSGSTLAAAKMLGRRWLGIEIDQRYHGIATERMGQSVARPPLTIPQLQSAVPVGASA